MTRCTPIWRIIVATVLTVAYVVMSVVAATHSLLHIEDHSPISEQGAFAAVVESGAHAGADHGLPASESSATSGCFFCAHGPTVLVLLPVALLVALVSYLPPAPSPVRARRLKPSTLSANSLRAPPVIA